MVPPTESLRFVADELGKCGRNLEEIGAKCLGPNRFGVFLKNIAKRLSTVHDLGHIGKLEANLSSFKTALRVEVLETVDARLYHVKPACMPNYHHAVSSLPQIPDSLHRLAKKQSHRPPDFVSRHVLIKTEMIASTQLWAGGVSYPRGLWRTWTATNCQSAGCSKNWWGEGCVGARNKSEWGVFWTF